MVHRRLNHPDERAVLIIADFSANKFADYQELKNFFDEVILFPYRTIEHDTDIIIDSISRMYEERVPYKITEFDDIYVAAAHYYFSLYLVANKVRFHFIEDGCGILSKPKVSYDIVMNYAPVQANIAQTYGMFDGNNPYVIDRICNVAAQSFPLKGSNVIDFDLVRETKKCDRDYIDAILKFFRIKKTNEDLTGAALIFTQQLANLGMVTFEEQVVIYQLIIDFFLPDKKILFKTHPDDVMYYSYLFPKSKTLKGRYPAELLPFITDKMAETSLTVFSSSVLSVRSAFQENIFCGYDFDKTYKKIDSYYFVLDILSNLHTEEYSFYGHGVDIKLIENLLQYGLQMHGEMSFEYPRCLSEQAEKKSIIVIDDRNFISDVFKNIDRDMKFEYERTEITLLESIVADSESEIPEDMQIMRQVEEYETFDTDAVIDLLEKVKDNDIVVFVNTQRDYCFYRYDKKDIFASMIPVRINRTRLRDENVYYEDTTLTLYFYTRDKGVESMIKNYEQKKQLENTGIQEQVFKMTDDQRRIAILEGMLEATEKRLQYYIEKEKQEKED